MATKSFGEWYELQKTNPSLSPANSRQSLWLPSIFKSNNNDSDVESSGLLSRVKNVRGNIAEAGDTVKFVLLFGGLAALFFAIAFFIGIPTLVLRPAKFSLSFTMGSFMTIAAVATLQGTERFFNSVFKSQRIVNTVFYFVSLFMTIFFSLKRSYMGTVVSSVFQIIMLSVFVIESIPSGGVVITVLKKAISKKTSFWFTVAMLYKMSMIPFIISPFYLGYMVFNCDILSYSNRLTPMAIIEIIAVVMLLLIAFVEYKPKLIYSILPKSFIKTDQAFVNQHRLLMVFLRYIFFYTVFFMLTRTNLHYDKCLYIRDEFVEECFSEVYYHIFKYLVGFLVTMVIYYICARYVKAISEVKLI